MHLEHKLITSKIECFKIARSRELIDVYAWTMAMDTADALLTKWEWTDADFERMGWHDGQVHAFAAVPEAYEFLLDIDYIVRWEKPDPAQGYYTFWVAPATLIFHHAYAVEVHVGPSQGDMTILELARTDEQLTPNGNAIDWHWSAFGVGGHFQLRATSYTQYIRRRPRLGGRSLSLDERGGISFSRRPFKRSRQ